MDKEERKAYMKLYQKTGRSREYEAKRNARRRETTHLKRDPNGEGLVCETCNARNTTANPVFWFKSGYICDECMRANIVQSDKVLKVEDMLDNPTESNWDAPGLKGIKI